MKQTIKILSLLLVVLAFSSCKSDDSNSEYKAKSELKTKIVGSWLLIKEEGFDKSNNLVETNDLKVGENCEYDRLDFLPSNSVNFLSHYIVKDNPDCLSKRVEDAYRFGILDYRRIVLSNGEARNEFFVDTLDENVMILDRMLSNNEALDREKSNPKLVVYSGEPLVYRIKVHYQRVK